jgi:hypothetical protein
MTTSEDREHWTGPRLTARLIALKGVAPTPVLHVIFRSTRRVDGSLVEGYHAPGEPRPIAADDVEHWITIRLGSTDRLAVAVLVIRETLDTHGMILQCTIERRRGSADGPYCGDPVRVDFAGAATAVRLYRSHPDGRLTEITPTDNSAPPRLHSPEQFAGEHKALQARFGAPVQIIDSRGPTLFEDMVGLSTVAHVHTTDGRDIGCGIGWFGDMPFILEADFPRFAAPLVLSDTDEAAVDAALRENGLVRGATRLDRIGIAVTARRHGSDALLLIRPSADGALIEPLLLSREAAGPDQQRWIRYAETYEGLTVLDVWRDGDSDDVIALTGDASGQLWRHHIDIDGVETWRKADDDAAIGAAHRERLFPGMLADTDAAPGATYTSPPLHEFVVQDTEGSLLALAEACDRAMAALHSACEAPHHLADSLPALEQLGAHVTAASVRALQGRFDPDLVAAFEPMLRQELATIHCLVIPASRARLFRHAEPPFGAHVAHAFPSSAYDIAEAALCLALRRPTACAFHCSRIVERAISAFARACTVNDPLADGERDWDAILRALNRDGDTTPPFSALQAVRRRWRGALLVVDDKHTEEEAEGIFTSVATLMHALAEVCDEHGNRAQSSR